MSQGTLYATQQIRSLAPKALIKHFGLDVKITEKDDTYHKYFPLDKIPAFIGPKGLKLHEVIAICLYCMYFTFNQTMIVQYQLMSLYDEKFFQLLYSYPCLNRLCRELII